jgi:hypothetical protein
MNEMVLKNVTASLDMMWKGMLGLFVVCGGITLIMMIVAKLIRGRKTGDEG